MGLVCVNSRHGDVLDTLITALDQAGRVRGAATVAAHVEALDSAGLDPVRLATLETRLVQAACTAGGSRAPRLGPHPPARRRKPGNAALRDEGHTVVDPQEQQLFELWRREFVTAPAMPPPDQATELIITWLEKTLDIDAG